MVSTGIGRRYEDGEVIFREGDRADRLYVVLEGTVELVRQSRECELSTGVLSHGALFGELAVLDGETHVTSARAHGPVRVLTIDRHMLLRRSKEDPSFAVRILQRLAERIRDLTEDLASAKRAGPSPRPAASNRV